MHLGPKSSPVSIGQNYKVSFADIDTIIGFNLCHARGILSRDLSREKKPRAKFQPMVIKKENENLIYKWNRRMSSQLNIYVFQKFENNKNCLKVI